MPDLTSLPKGAVVINGHILTRAQVMTLGAAIGNFSAFLSENDLGDDEHGRLMHAAYRDGIRQIARMMASHLLPPT